MIDTDAEFIPVLTIEQSQLSQNESVPEELPIMPLRNSVLYPGTVIPITVGREKSIQLVKEYSRKRKPIGVIAQKESNVDEPVLDDLYKVGTSAQILKTFEMPDGSVTVIIQGIRRFEVVEPIQNEPYMKAAVIPYAASEDIPNTRKFEALLQSVRDLAIQVIPRSRNLSQEAGFAIKSIEDPVFLLNFVASNVEAELPVRQGILEARNLNEIANGLLSVLTEAYDSEVLGTDDKGKEDVRTVMRFHPMLAPFKCAVLPLSKKLSDKAYEVYQMLSEHFMVDFDDTGSIGKRYRREDEIGTPFCITYDFDTAENDSCVTVRDRDTMEQVRIPITELVAYLSDKIKY